MNILLLTLIHFSFYIESIPLLIKVINDSDSKAPSVITVTDNAMSAVARICSAFYSKIDLNIIVPGWIVGLPVTHDKEEAPAVYSWLFKLLKECSSLVLGPSGERTQFIVSAINTAVSQNVLSEQSKSEAISIISHFTQH